MEDDGIALEMIGAMSKLKNSANETERREAAMTILTPIYEKLTPGQLTYIQCKLDKCSPFQVAVSVATFFLVISIVLISTLGIFKPFIGNSKWAILRRSSMIIIALAPVFALLSWFNVTFPWLHDFFEIPGIYMEALAIFSFYRILVYMLGGEEECAQFLNHGITQVIGANEELLAPHDDALVCRCLRIKCIKFKSGEDRMKWTRILIAQIAVVRVLFMTANAFVRYFMKNQSSVRIIVLTLSFCGLFSFVVAMISLLQFYIVVRKPFNVVYNENRRAVKYLKWKFILMKALLSVIVLQNLIVNFMIRFNIGLKRVRATGGNVEDRFIRLVGTITIFEMLIFSILLRIFFDPLQHGSPAFKTLHEAYLGLIQDDDASSKGTMANVTISDVAFKNNTPAGSAAQLSNGRYSGKVLKTIGVELLCPLVHLARPMTHE